MELKTLADGYFAAMEWNLATLEELAMLKSSSKSRIERQVRICGHMLEVCVQIENVDGMKPRQRTAEILKAAKIPGQTIRSAFATYVKSLAS